jgi:hypothetical protein
MPIVNPNTGFPFDSSATTEKSAKAKMPAAVSYRGMWSVLLVALGATVFFYLHLFHFALTPIWRDGDESTFLDHAEHMLQGQVLYRDLFQFNLPGTEYLYYFLFSVFGLHLWVGHLALLITLTCITVLIYQLSSAVLRGPAILIPPLAFLTVFARAYLDGSHHWYSTLLVLLTIYLVTQKQLRFRLELAGAVLGLATLFTSTRGLCETVGVAVFIILEHRSIRAASKKLFAFLIPYLTLVCLALIYLDLRVGPKTLYNSLVVFPLRYYSAGAANSFDIYYSFILPLWPLNPSRIWGCFVWLTGSFALPVILIAFAARRFWGRSRSCSATYPERILALYAIAGFCALLPVVNAPSPPRLVCAVSLAYILGTKMLLKVGKRRVIGVALAILVLGGMAELSVAIFRPYYIVSSRRGQVAFQTRDRSRYIAWFAKNARPGDLAFGDSDISFLLGLENPASIQWVERDAYSRPEQVRALVNQLRWRRTRFVLYYELTGQGTEDNLQPIRDYLGQNYHIVGTDPSDPSTGDEELNCPTCSPIFIRNAT